MCGRYARRSDKHRLAEAFQVGNLGDAVFQVQPSYNIAPTTFQPVIRENRDTGEREMTLMRWGLIPYWTKDIKKLGVSTINAKAETILEKSMWRVPLERRRCLVPADAFYEWKKVDAKSKQPYAFGMASDEPFAFAGLWDRWKALDGQPLDSFTIITTSPNELTANVHDRMPVILKHSDYDRWLHPEFGERSPIDLLIPFDADKMKSWKVDPKVGSVKNDEPGLCLEWN